MDKKVRNILYLIVLLLIVSNVMLIYVMYSGKVYQSYETHKPTHYYKESLHSLNFNQEQKDHVSSICKKLKKDGESTMREINPLYSELVNEVSKEVIDSSKVDFLESEIAELYKIILHKTVSEYKDLTSELSEEQIKKLECIYLDLFIRIHNTSFQHENESINEN